MKIYIAAPWIDREAMPAIATRFENDGHTITHKWWEAENTPESPEAVKIHSGHAFDDWNGVVSADTLVLLNTSKSEGKAVEQGLAIASDIPIVAVGQRGALSKNVFHYLPCYTWVDDIEGALDVCKPN